MALHPPRNQSLQDSRGGPFSPDGKLLATAGTDGTVRLWNTATGQPHGTPLRPNTTANALAISPNGRLLASANTDGTVRLWSLTTGQPHGTPLRAGGGITGVNDVAFSPDGKLLATASGGGTVQLWNPVTGQPLSAPLQASTTGPNTVNGVAFSPDGNLLASADGDATIRLWEVSLFAHPYSALCADVGPPLQQALPQQVVDQYAISGPELHTC